MKANELRIGNYVKREVNSDPDFLEVSEICKNRNDYSGYAVYFTNGDSSSFEHDDSLTPIPLTEQWLLDFGFKMNCFEDDYCMDLRNDNGMGEALVIDLELKESFINYFNRRTKKIGSIVFLNNIKHVHQLQNLYFALTGEELIKQSQPKGQLNIE